jgi:hypothetical protein
MVDVFRDSPASRVDSNDDDPTASGGAEPFFRDALSILGPRGPEAAPEAELPES